MCQISAPKGIKDRPLAHTEPSCPKYGRILNLGPASLKKSTSSQLYARSLFGNLSMLRSQRSSFWSDNLEYGGPCSRLIQERECV
ncbi:hypothetical protein M8J76_005724 [Diaphorina citri]|nr:hypothetical protein M8J76_005724 [Diaphorina citri]